MRSLPSLLVAFACAALIAQACTCAGAPGGPDAGCAEDTCAACPPGCTQADVCEGSAWTCGCSCSANAENFCQTLAQRECDFGVRCHTAPSLVGEDPSEGRGTPPFGYQDQLAASEQARCEALLSGSLFCRQAEASFSAGRSRFDAVAFSACLAAAYPADGCARDFNQVQELCLKVGFALPQSGGGALCQADTECDAGFCDAPSSAAACGACRPYVAQNGTCDRAAQCAPGAWCAIPTGQSSGTCLPLKAQGDSCNPYSLSAQAACGPGRVCALQGGFIPSGSCQAGLIQGQACVIDRYQCLRSGRALPELLCAHDPASGQDLCAPLQSGPGGACETGEQVIPSTSGTGTRGPVCRETEFCLDHACTARKPALSPCASDLECVAGTRCLDTGAGLLCQPFAELAQACAGDGDCKNLLGCDGGTCASQYAAVGEGCVQARCAAGACEAGSCVPLRGTGEGCTAGAQCASDVCGATCTAACWQP